MPGSTMQAVIASDENGFVTEWSPEAQEIFGYSEQEVTGWSLGAFVHSLEKLDPEKKRIMILDNILEAVESGETVTFSTVNLRADLKAFSNTVVITRKEGGGTQGVITKNEDTPVIKAYNKLVDREHEKPMAVTTYDGRVLAANGKFTLLAKTNRMQLLNRYVGRLENAALHDLAEFEGFQGILMVL